MSDSVFGLEYADQYDLLYGDKNYGSECDLLEQVFQRYGNGEIHTILDLGCGTGNHAIPLASRGYSVTGVDLSAEMLAQARHKVQTDFHSPTSTPPTFLEGDILTVALGKSFDVVLMMFAVLGYQLTNVDVVAALSTVRRHLKPGGLFICDVWYGPAVLTIRPSDRIKVIPTPDGKVIRAASGKLDTYRQLCAVSYQVWRIKSEQVVSESQETHQMRYFFPQELSLFLSQARLKYVAMHAFGNTEQLPNENDWNALVVAKAL